MKKLTTLLVASAVTTLMYPVGLDILEDWTGSHNRGAYLPFYTQDAYQLKTQNQGAASGLECTFSNGFHSMMWSYFAPATQPVYLNADDVLTLSVNYTIVGSSSKGAGQTGLRVGLFNSDSFRLEKDVPRLRLNSNTPTAHGTQSAAGFTYVQGTNDQRQYWSLGHGAHDSDGGYKIFSRMSGNAAFCRISTNPGTSTQIIDPRRRKQSQFPRLSLIAHTGAWGNTVDGMTRYSIPATTTHVIPANTTFQMDISLTRNGPDAVQMDDYLYTTDSTLDPTLQCPYGDLYQYMTQVYDNTNAVSFPNYAFDMVTMVNFWGAEVGLGLTLNSVQVTGPEMPVTPAWSPAFIGDLSGEGNDDILWISESQGGSVSGGVTLWLMNGGSVVGAADIFFGNNAWKPCFLGDFDGNGTEDILWQASADPSQPAYAIWTMNGLSVLSGATITDGYEGWKVVAVSDFNGDNKADLLWNNIMDGQACIWLMDGTNVSSVVTIGGAVGWEPVKVADFNGDNSMDIMWRRGAATYAELEHVILPVKPTNNTLTLEAGDAPLDCHIDSVMHSVSIWLMSGTSVSSAVDSIANPGSGWAPEFVADFNADTNSDILWVNDVTGETAIWTMNGTAVSGSQTTTKGWYNWGDSATAPTWNDSTIAQPLLWAPVAVGKHDVGATADIVWYNYASNAVAVWHMDATGLAPTDAVTDATIYDGTPLSFNGTGNWHLKATGDFNGDGKMDLVFYRINTPTGGEAAVWITGDTVYSLK